MENLESWLYTRGKSGFLRWKAAGTKYRELFQAEVYARTAGRSNQAIWNKGSAEVMGNFGCWVPWTQRRFTFLVGPTGTMYAEMSNVS